MRVLLFMVILHVALYWPFKNSGFVGFLHRQLLANGPLALVYSNLLAKVTCIANSYTQECFFPIHDLDRYNPSRSL